MLETVRESIELLEASQLPQLAEAMDLTKTIDLSSTQGKGLLGRLAAAGGPGSTWACEPVAGSACEAGAASA